MFDISFKAEALIALKRMKRYDAVQIVNTIEEHLQHEPEKTSKSRIKRLRGKQRATYRLRVGDYRVFFDVAETSVSILNILHKDETVAFYRPEEEP